MSNILNFLHLKIRFLIGIQNYFFIIACIRRMVISDNRLKVTYEAELHVIRMNSFRNDSCAENRHGTIKFLLYMVKKLDDGKRSFAFK